MRSPTFALIALAALLASCAHSGPSTSELEVRIAALESRVAEQTAEAEAAEAKLAENEALAARVASLEAKVKDIEDSHNAPARPTPPAEEAQTAPYDIPVGPSDHVVGAAKATVTIVVFTDFQCPFCARLHNVVSELLGDPELKGKLRVVYKHFPLPFHSEARPAARAAIAISEQGNKLFWPFVDKLFQHQRELNDENFSKWAGEVGANVKKFERAVKMNAGKYDERIDADIKLGSEEAKVRGTPSLVINGWLLVGAQPASRIKEAMREHNIAF